MATSSISQIRRIVMRKYANDAWTTFTIDSDSLSGDEVLSFNIAPRKIERSSAMGTTNAPIDGTLDDFSASITFLADTWATLGKVVGRWNSATYAGATNNNGNMIGGDPSTICGDGEYYSVIVQGICDDGSSSDVEFTRCMPSIDDDITVSSSETTEVTLALNPQIYNATIHSNDGYPQYSYRLGDNSLTEKQRLNVTSGGYEAVTE